MNKLKSSATNMALVLTLISVLTGGLLAFVNSQTADTIEELKQKREVDAIANVLGGGEVTVTDTVKVPNPAKPQSSDSIWVYVTNKGYAVKTFDPNNKSFGGGLTIMVGFDENGTILGYEIVESHETPGLGAKANKWFQKDGKGCIIGKNLSNGTLAVSKDKGDVDAITASTITSRAFLNAVNAAYAATLEAQQAECDSDADGNADELDNDDELEAIDSHEAVEAVEGDNDSAASPADVEI